jgi:hypothetical protein
MGALMASKNRKATGGANRAEPIVTGRRACQGCVIASGLPTHIKLAQLGLEFANA